ncbi:hypothetical protein ACIGXM_02925 [Kitasatospora sp. NPDC052896]|uniref:hypothetical protein n=1 Tax=Kitasatospora sp. NPDC052896 TaxID=3364061 RepID=UPI0037C6B147
MTEDRFGRDAKRAEAAAEGRGEEAALRALLHGAVDGLQPAADALPRIRRAIPARRARHRQVWTGAAVVALATAVLPTLNSLGALQLSDGSAPGGGSGGAAAAPAPRLSAPARGQVPLPVPAASAGLSSPSASAEPVSAGPSVTAGGPSASAAGPAAAAAGAPDCVRTDLGGGAAQLGAPDAAGRRYGYFSVANVSGHACVVADPGTVSVSGGTGAIRVVAHTVGDPAGGLPDPASLPARLLLAAAASYRLPFAWVPDSLCPAAGPSPVQSAGQGAGTAGTSASPSPSPSGAGAPVSAGPALSNGTAGPAAPAAPVADGPASPGASPSPAATVAPAVPASLTVGHQPLGTGPDAASTVIDGVCGGGTLYRSVPQAAS